MGTGMGTAPQGHGGVTPSPPSPHWRLGISPPFMEQGLFIRIPGKI